MKRIGFNKSGAETMLGQPRYTILEIDKLIKEIDRLAVGIKAQSYKPTDDPDYQKLAISLFRLSAELKTFSNSKLGHLGTP